ncbi:MAG: DNA mismatch repair endonuclease MutL [Brevinematia bacterium]
MSKIKLLPEEIIAKISAGEVIEAPYSVVRELIDNSIDAGSSKIIVNVIEGGKKLIEVIDDGEGMDKEDLEKCYLRHSTSKINELNDIYRITTMGFRGEALGSIAEVSEIEIISKPKNQNEGYKLIVKGGKLVSISPHPSKDGTTVRVRDLFFNVPARKNFLKSPSSEFKSIIDTFIKKSIPFIDIHFELFNDLKREITLPKTNSTIDRIKTIYPEIRELNHTKKTLNDMEIEIFFSKPSLNRPTRNLQQLFVNNRFVESKTFFTAVSNAYSNLVPKGNFPIVFCFIKINPSLIDVNIHPAKKEIKFQNEGKLFHYITESIKEGLSNSIQILNIEDTPKFNRFENDIKKSIEAFITRTKEISTPLKEYNEKTISTQKIQQTRLLNNETIYTEPTNTKQQYIVHEKKQKKLDNIKFIGTIFKTYLIFEDTENNKMIVIDQHAAHEKLIYLRLYKEIIENKKTSKQALISPIEINLSKEFLKTIKENIDIISKVGFDIKFYEDKIEILSIPSLFNKDIDIKGTIIEICEKIKDGLDVRIENIIEILATISCRNAIKSGYIITTFEAYKLLEEILNTPESISCPHGRPSIIQIDEKTLESIFLRAK